MWVKDTCVTCVESPNIMKLILRYLFWKLELRSGTSLWAAASIFSHCLWWNFSFNIFYHLIHIMVPLPLLVIYSISILSSSSLADTQLVLQKSTFWSSGVLGGSDSTPSSEAHSEQSNPIWWLVICLCHQTKPSQRDIKGSWLRWVLEEVFHKEMQKKKGFIFCLWTLCWARAIVLCNGESHSEQKDDMLRWQSRT